MCMRVWQRKSPGFVDKCWFLYKKFCSWVKYSYSKCCLFRKKKKKSAVFRVMTIFFFSPQPSGGLLISQFRWKCKQFTKTGVMSFEHDSSDMEVCACVCVFSALFWRRYLSFPSVMGLIEASVVEVSFAKSAACWCWNLCVSTVTDYLISETFVQHSELSPTGLW